jgi:hypothetical protein
MVSAPRFEPRPLRSAGEVRRVDALQHDALDAALTRAGAQRLQLVPIGEWDHRRHIEGGTRRAVPGFEAATALGKGQGAQIVATLAQHVVKPHRRRMIAQHLRIRRFAVEALLQIVERRNLARAHDQQLAVERHPVGDRRDDVGKGAPDVVPRARVEPPVPAAADQLHPDAVPFPFCEVVVRVYRLQIALFERLRQH